MNWMKEEGDTIYLIEESLSISEQGGRVGLTIAISRTKKGIKRDFLKRCSELLPPMWCTLSPKKVLSPHGGPSYPSWS